MDEESIVIAEILATHIHRNVFAIIIAGPTLFSVNTNIYLVDSYERLFIYFHKRFYKWLDISYRPQPRAASSPAPAEFEFDEVKKIVICY